MVLRRDFQVIYLKYMCFIASIVLVGCLQATPASASKPLTITPGVCVTYDEKAIFTTSNFGRVVNCTRSHNSEVYRVIILSKSQDLNKMSPLQQYDFANSKCQPWSKPSKQFNQWAYRFPSATQWRNGNRQLICEAMITNPSPEDPTVLVPTSWTGKRLDFK